MSKGTKMTGVRIGDALMMEITAAIASRNLWTRSEPWTVSDFVRVAVIEKLNKIRRGRSPRSRRRPSGDPAFSSANTLDNANAFS